jgi:ketosteroid isomerase-like protein
MNKMKSMASQLIVNLHLIILACVFAGCAGNADELTTEQLNTAVVHGYFTALDSNDAAAIPNLFAADARQEFVGNAPLVGVAAILQQFQISEAQLQSMKTEYLTTVADGDTVVVQVRHDAVFKSGGAIKTRNGVTPGLVIFSQVTPITWRALAVFKLLNGKIVEEIIIRDELSMMMQMGSVVLQLP